MRALRALLIDGLLLALPVIAVAYLLTQAIRFVVAAFAPLAALIPNAQWLGVAVIDVLAIVVLLGALLVLGLLMRSSAGRALAVSAERVALRRFPGFLLLKSMATAFSSRSREAVLKPALVRFDDSCILAFAVESNPDSALWTVFLPSAPAPVVGNVALVEKHRIALLDVPVSAVIGAIGRLGLGAQQLIRPELTCSAAMTSKDG